MLLETVKFVMLVSTPIAEQLPPGWSYPTKTRAVGVELSPLASIFPPINCITLLQSPGVGLPKILFVMRMLLSVGPPWLPSNLIRLAFVSS